MGEFVVLIEPSALADLEESLEWGIHNWGLEKAIEWFDEMERTILQSLSIMPSRCPVAPDDDIEQIVRELILERYRVLFTIKEQTVLVLRVRGPYVGE